MAPNDLLAIRGAGGPAEQRDIRAVLRDLIEDDGQRICSADYFDIRLARKQVGEAVAKKTLVFDDEDTDWP